MLGAMLSVDPCILSPAKRDELGAFVLVRDSTYFGYILRYLNGDDFDQLVKELSVTSLKRMRVEADYFQLSDMEIRIRLEIMKRNIEEVKFHLTTIEKHEILSRLLLRWESSSPRPGDPIFFDCAAIGDWVQLSTNRKVDGNDAPVKGQIICIDELQSIVRVLWENGEQSTEVCTEPIGLEPSVVIGIEWAEQQTLQCE